MKEEFESIENSEEILSIFLESLDETSPIMLWQKAGDGSRRYVAGYLREINEEKLAIGLIQNDKNLVELDKKSHVKVNVTGNYSNFYFQSKVSFASATNIVIPIPEKIRFLAKKLDPVYFYENPEDNLVTYKLLSQKKDKKLFKVEILSLTPSKMTFYSDEAGLGKLSVGEELLITSLSKHNTPNFQIGKIKYICYYQTKSVARMRPCRVTVKLIPAIAEMAKLPLHVEKQEKRFGMEEIEWMQREKGTFKEESTTQSAKSTFDYGYEQDGFFYGYKINEQSAVLHEISLRDDRLARDLEENCAYIENLIYLTPSMRQELFRDVEVPLVAYALRLSTKHLITDIMDSISHNLKSELLYNLREKKTATAVLKAQKELIRYLRQREGTGSFVIDRKLFRDAS